MGDFKWTAENETILRRLWDAGWTASQIAPEIPGTTRNAIVGKARRLNLASRAPTGWGDVREKTKAAQRQREPLVIPLRPISLPKAIQPENPDRLLSLLELTDRTCRFPIGTPGQPDFGFCGKQTKSGSAYCEECHSKAYQPKRKAVNTHGIDREAA